MTGTNCNLFTHKLVPVIFEPPCIMEKKIKKIQTRINLKITEISYITSTNNTANKIN